MRRYIKKHITVDLKILTIKMKGLLLVILMIFSSCNCQKKAAMNNEEDTNIHNEKLTLLLQDNYSGSDVSETLVIKDAKELKSFYSKINQTRKPGLPVPEVDFTKEIILVHCSGLRKSNVAPPSLSVLEETDEELVLETTNGKVEQKGGDSAEISPFSVYKMPLTSKKIIFKKED